MIRAFRKYQKTVGGILIVVVAALVMSSFGVDLAHRDQRAELQKAFTVDDTVVSKADFQRKVRQVETQYRRMFGSQYDQFAKQFGLDVPQNVLDSMIDATILNKKLHQEGFAGSDAQVREAILEQFPGGYDPNALLSSGTTPSEFLKEVEQDAQRKQLYDILSDAALVTEAERQALFVKEQSEFKVEYVRYAPERFESLVKEPSEEALAAFFQENQEQYRTKPKASFNFIIFHPEDYLSQIEIPTDEVEFYYTDNPSEFRIPESLDLQHVQILFPKESDPTKLAAAREKATNVLAKANAGEDFKSLALQYSDDVTTKMQAGKLGWVPRGRYSATFDEKTYAKKDGGIAELIEVEYGFHIVKVNGYKEASVKPLEEVKDAILTKLKQEQAPAIADAAARELFDKFLSGDASLTELAQAANMKVSSSEGLVEETSTIPNFPKDVTSKVFASLPEMKQFIEDKRSAYVVEIIDQKEAEIPELTTVKNSVLKNYRIAESQKAAKNSADEALAQIQSGKDFKETVKATNGELKTLENVRYIDQNPALSAEDIKTEVFEAKDLPSRPSRTFFNNGAFLIFSVLSKKEADYAKATPEQLKALDEKAHEENTETFRKKILDSLKTGSKIDVSPSLLNEL